MDKDKAIKKISTTSLERVSNQISVVNKLLSKRWLRISRTRSTPEVILNNDGFIKINGRSIPDDALKFFKPIEEWVNKYICDPAEVTYIDINLDIINADSKKFLIQIIQKITYVSLKHKKSILNWNYEEGNEEILEAGESLSSVLDVPFNYILMKANEKH